MEPYEKTRENGYICIPLGNHDNARINVNRSYRDLELIMAFGLTMPGIPFIWNGNEIGMRQLYGLPYVEGAYQPRAGNRTPMQWSKGKNLGFSDGNPTDLYLPVDSAEDAPTVAEQEKDPHSLLNRVRAIIQLKKREPALMNCAEFVPVYAQKDGYPFIYARASGDEAILCVFNPANRAEQAKFTLNVEAKTITHLEGDALELKQDGNTYSIETPAVSYSFIKITY